MSPLSSRVDYPTGPIDMTPVLEMMVRRKGLFGRYEITLVDTRAGYVRLKGPGRQDKRTKVSLEDLDLHYTVAPSARA